MSLLQPSDLAGRRILGVTATWHVFNGERKADPLDFWLHLEPAGTTVHFDLAADGQSVQLAAEAVGQPVDMAEYGRIVIEPVGAAHILGTLVDQRIASAHWLINLEWNVPKAGVVVCLESGRAVAIANEGDELELQAWPSIRLARLGFAIQRN